MEDGYYILRDEYIDNLQWKVKELEKEKSELEKMVGERSTSIIEAHSALSEDDREEYLKMIKELEWQLAESQIKQEQLEQRNAYLEEKINLGDGEEKSSSNELEELKVNYEYLCKKNWRLKKWYEIALRLTYKYAAKNMNITKEEYEEQLSEEISRILEEEYWKED